MATHPIGENIGNSFDVSHLARMVLVAFLVTFAIARITVFLIMSHTIPDLYVHVQGTHIHHLNYGIFLLSGLGGYLLFGNPAGRRREIIAVAYGIGMGLTFDEFGMWVHLGGTYWQRASWDAIAAIGAFLALVAFASTIKRLRPRHWLAGITLACILTAFFILLHRSIRYAGREMRPEIQKVESNAPH